MYNKRSGNIHFLMNIVSKVKTVSVREDLGGVAVIEYYSFFFFISEKFIYNLWIKKCCAECLT